MEKFFTHPFVLFLLICLPLLGLLLLFMHDLIRRDIAEDKRREQREVAHQETLRSIREGKERLANGYTRSVDEVVADLAKCAGIPPGAVYKGKPRPVEEIMADLQRVLKIPPNG